VTHRITEECIVCGACEEECPEQAISETGGRFVIDAERCSDCGTCAEACPVGACVPD
jgi:ferredoxin